MDILFDKKTTQLVYLLTLMTVLKDATATALYGSRAANGVVLITTKRVKLVRHVLTQKSNMVRICV